MTPGVDGAVLAVLAGTTGPLTGRQIARLAARGTSPSVSAALDRLAEHGLVHRQVAGRAYLHTLNRDHVAAPAVEALAGLRGELLRRLRDALADWEPAPVHASMFGSAARADGDTSSDIDLLVIRADGVDAEDERWRDQIHALAESVHAWTGNHAGISELAEAELVKLRRKPPPVLKDVRADGIDLAGVPVRSLRQGQVVSPRHAKRTQDCNDGDARRRLADARAQLDLAELATATSSAEEKKAAASCAVLAGIAAADAACCKSLGRRSRSQDHRDAVALVRQVAPGGADAAKQLERLLGLKDQAQYGFEDIGGQRLAAARRQARTLVAFAEDALAR